MDPLTTILTAVAAGIVLKLIFWRRWHKWFQNIWSIRKKNHAPVMQVVRTAKDISPRRRKKVYPKESYSHTLYGLPIHSEPPKVCKPFTEPKPNPYQTFTEPKPRPVATEILQEPYHTRPEKTYHTRPQSGETFTRLDE